MMIRKINRRMFLHSTIWLTGLMLFRPARTLKMLSSYCQEDRLTKRLMLFFSERESAVIIGRAYLRLVPEEAEVDKLVDLVCCSSLLKRRNLLKADRARFRRLLQAQNRIDFEHDCTVAVNGWILAKTEARLCALTALS